MKGNLRMPAEWEKQDAVWLQWPSEKNSHGYQMKLEPIWLRMVEVLSQSAIVRICANNEADFDHVARQLSFYDISSRNVDIDFIPTDDVWVRDNGPTFVKSEDGIAAIIWRFNGWGGRYLCNLDKKVPYKIAKILDVPFFEADMVAEGGNIEVNGWGDMICSRSAILNKNRNPDMSREQAEEVFKKYLGVRNIIWLPGAETDDIEKTGWSDDTDTHVDTIARFVNPDTIVYNWADSSTDCAHPVLNRNFQALKQAVLASGKRPRLVPLPIPRDGYYSTSKVGVGGAINGLDYAVRTDASYTNFLISNGVVLVPVYGNINDTRALKILGELFPRKEVIGINCGAIAENGGEIHCITQQQPEA